MPDGQTLTDSPFHAGEQAIQERMGVRESMEAFGRRVIHDHMPDQHRAFYAQLPFLFLGALDDEGRPWASLVAGEPGVLSSPNARTLRIGADLLPGDPLHGSLTAGRKIGLLGLEFESRRRNRMNGRIVGNTATGFEIEVVQAFGNCPQYIQNRSVRPAPDFDGGKAPALQRARRLGDAERLLIERADTLFIASHYAGPDGSAANGVDVSHRGGKPGFVRIEDDRTISWPDFSGNNHFNTIGNLALNPKAGHLFIDFEHGDLLYLTGEAQVIWEGAEVKAFQGAERIVRFRLDEAIRLEGALPVRFDFGDYSPILERTGSWDQAAATIVADAERNAWLDYEIVRVEKESEVISSFYLKRADDKALPSYEPGQFLPIRLSLPGHDEPVTRTYTVSEAPGSEHYRLSIKRESGKALVSNFLHDNAKPGFRLKAMAPRGTFTLDQSSDRPVVLISGGVGITPMIAMLNHIVAEGERTRHYRRTFFVHGAINGATHAFGAHVRELADRQKAITAHIRYSDPAPSDAIGVDHDSAGYVDAALLQEVLPLGDYDFYLCGPGPFMQAIYDALTELGVRDERIRYESFGPATVLKPDATEIVETTAEPVRVSFAKSGVETEWDPANGTLLELAEASGLSPTFACRSGTCGSCATRIRCGAVDYLDDPVGPRADDEVLICSATPRAADEGGCGEDRGVVLEL